MLTLIGCNLFSSAELITLIGHRKEIRIFYTGQLTLSTQLLKPNYLVLLPTDATQHFNLAPLFTYWVKIALNWLEKIAKKHAEHANN